MGLAICVRKGRKKIARGHDEDTRVCLQAGSPVREEECRGCTNPRKVGRYELGSTLLGRLSAPTLRPWLAPLLRYPDRIPVICEKDMRSDIPPVDKRKYLIPMDLTVGQFVYVIRKRISIPSDKAIFIFVNNTLPPTAALMSTVYEQNRDEDGFMYFMYSGENTFGGEAVQLPA